MFDFCHKILLLTCVDADVISDVDASFLVPSSPANQNLMSVATGELIDFS